MRTGLLRYARNDVQRKFSFLILIASIFLIGCNNVPHIRKDVTYPDVISPIYYIDTFQIKSPRIALVDSVPYIFSLEELEPFENKEDFIKQKGVIRYLTPDMHSDRGIGYIDVYKTSNTNKSFYDLASQIEFDWDELFIQEKCIKNIPIYKFAFEPKTFLLTIISTKYNQDMQVLPAEGDCYFVPAVFSMDYILAIKPIYSKQDVKKINKLCYSYLWGEDPDWTYYLPNWVYNLFF